MGKRTIKARKINWLRLFLVKILGVAKSGKSHAPQNLSSGLCDSEYRVYTTSRGVTVENVPSLSGLEGDRLRATELKHYPDLKQEIS